MTLEESELLPQSLNHSRRTAHSIADFGINRREGYYRVDVIVFTAGVGENQTGMRADACDGLQFLGIEIDKEKNATIRGKEALISTADSKVKVYVVPTDEEIVIARDTMELVK